MDPITSIVASMLISGAAAPADGHGCAEAPHYGDAPCSCTRVVDFYGPWTGGGAHWPGPGGWGPPINNPGPPIHVRAPGIRVVGRPINVAGPTVYIAGPPVYVDAPPIRIAPAQIYVQRPEVHVRPSEIMVEPPQVHFSDCADGTVCTPVDGDSGGGMPAYEATPPPVGEAVVLPSRVSPPPPPPVPVYPPKQDRN
ncbi:hypothetical protein [Brevundimonas sp.]|uniref:hypothetical protein n=1 Tax=Brevundimonas sp. TaxID=1871086 RepID=UPI00286CDE83|nr:hypothetical protein [Brevundimonas sp.]